jgi:hypothetical protein
VADCPTLVAPSRDTLIALCKSVIEFGRRVPLNNINLPDMMLCLIIDNVHQDLSGGAREYALQFGNRPVLLTFASKILFGRLPKMPPVPGFVKLS